MQLADRTGIMCDACSIAYRQDFDYYSLDFRCVSVIEDRRIPLAHILGQRVIMSLDLCTACFDNAKQRIITNYQKSMSDKREPASAKIVCEWTGATLSGSYDYYHCTVACVEVRIAGQPSVCVGCKTKTFDNKPCSKCGGTQFVKPAAVRTVDRFVEANICESAFQELVQQAHAMRRAAGEWTTKS